MSEPRGIGEIRLRVLASFVALGCGVAAAVIVILLVHTAIP
jgi:hypothetical protein